MLVAAIPGQSAMLHAQSVQNNTTTAQTAQGWVRTQTASSPVADAVEAVVEAVSDAVVTVVEAAQAVVETVVAAVTPAPEPAPVVVAPTPVSTQPQSSVASVPALSTSAATQPSAGTVAAPSVAQVFTVSNMTELRSALGAAQKLAGAEIRVNPGTYGDLIWERKTYPLGQVYIVAATSTKPVFRQIVVNGSTNMSFHGLKVTGLQSGRLVMMNGSRNMSFTGGEISGFTEDNRPFDESATGIQVRSSTNIVVQDNVFRDTLKAMYIQRSNNVFVRYNRMQYLREGVQVVATAGAQLRGNHISHFFPRYDLREHPDAIQFWTYGETVGSSKVRVLENLISMGGQRAVQGIFANDEAKVRYSDFEVSRNVYFGSSVHGITMIGVDGLKISNNVVAGSPHADVNNSIRTASTSGGYMPQIRLRTSTGVQVWNNITMFEGVNGDAALWPQLSQYDNWDIIDNIQKKGQPWTDFFVGGRPTSEAPELTAFLTRNPSATFTRNGGITSPYVHGVRNLSKNEQIAEVRSLLGF